MQPSTVEIFGSNSLLQSIDSVNTTILEFNDLSEPISAFVQLKEIPGIRFSVNRAKLNVEVQKIVEKSFIGIPIEVKNVPVSKELILYPSKLDIVLRGGINKLGRLTNDSIKVVVDYWEALKEEGGKVEPEIIVPNFTKVISAEPKKLEYIIKQY